MSHRARLETIASPSNWPGSVGKLHPAQIAQRSTWSRVPDSEVVMASLHRVHVIPANGTTVTRLNPMDPGTTLDTAGEYGVDWLARPGHHGRNFRAARR